MGDENCRPAYREKVAAYIRAHADELCEECNRRADTNPLRAFDCKNPACARSWRGAPLLRDELCDDCAAHYSAVKGHLDALGIPYVEDPTLVRGLDYYTRTVFEVQVDAGLGSQNAIGGGGRYDRLMEEYGGPPTPGLGFALGFERTLLAMEAAGVESPSACRAPRSTSRAWTPASAGAAFALVSALRDAGIAAEIDHQGRSLKSQFKQADRLGARFVVVVGPDELAAGEVTLRDMGTKEETTVALDRGRIGGLGDARPLAAFRRSAIAYTRQRESRHSGTEEAIMLDARYSMRSHTCGAVTAADDRRGGPSRRLGGQAPRPRRPHLPRPPRPHRHRPVHLRPRGLAARRSPSPSTVRPEWVVLLAARCAAVPTAPRTRTCPPARSRSSSTRAEVLNRPRRRRSRSRPASRPTS